MKKVAIAVVTVIIIALIAVLGFAIYWGSEQNPKGCINFENSKYVPMYEILDNVAYDVDGPEMAKIHAVKDSCLAVVKGQDTSVDKCQALSNLKLTLELIFANAANSKDAGLVSSTTKEIVNLKNGLDKEITTSCKAEYDELNEIVSNMEKLSKEVNSKK